MTKPHYRLRADGTIMLMDGFQNMVANIGTPRDKAAGATYRMVHRADEELIAAYRTAWLPRKIVDIPAQDATRRWRAWNADKKQTSIIEAEENRLGLQRVVRDALIAARLLGGAAIYIGTGEADVSRPLNPERIGSGGIRHLTVLARNHLRPSGMDTDPESPGFGRPAYYEMSSRTAGTVRIHPSRLAVFHGADLPIGAEGYGAEGWGDSVLQSCMDAIKGADGVAASAASLIYEANVDVLHIPRLMEMMGEPDGDTKVAQYLTMLGLTKSINGMLVLDAGDASATDDKSGGTRYERKGASFAGVGDIWDRFMQIASGAADIPATRLFGMSPAGMDATGDADLQNYAQKIGMLQATEITPALSALDECLIRSALGSRPAEIYYDWRPIWETTAKERAEIGKATADIVSVLSGTNLFPVETLQQAAANAMIETGALPGLEGAVDEHGLDLFDPDEGDDLMAMTPEQRREQLRAVGDAEPRTLYVSRKVLNAADIIEWAKGQGFTTTLDVADLHVTVAYSRTPLDWMKVGETWEETVEIAPGGPRLMEQFGEARVLLFASSSLKWRHEGIKDAGASWDHPDYQPHITISYDPQSPELAAVAPYTGKIVLGPEIFAEVDEDWAEKAKET